MALWQQQWRIRRRRYGDDDRYRDHTAPRSARWAVMGPGEWRQYSRRRVWSKNDVVFWADTRAQAVRYYEYVSVHYGLVGGKFDQQLYAAQFVRLEVLRRRERQRRQRKRKRKHQGFAFEE